MSSPHHRDAGGYHGRGVAVALVSCVVFATIVGAYVTSLRLLTRLNGTVEPNSSDGLYFGLHGAALLVAAVAGFSIGAYFRELGFAFATLFIAAILVVMMAAQVASFELACAGHNDIIRHWQC